MSKLPAVQPLWLNFRPLPVSRIAWHTCIIPQNVCTCVCFINIYCQAILETGSGRKLSHNGRTAVNLDLPDHGFLLLTCSTGPMKWSTGNSFQTVYLCFQPLPFPMAARITKYLNKYVRRGLCLIYIYLVFISGALPWRPEVDHNWAIMVVQPTILTYPTMVFNFWLAPQVLWNDLRWIVIKQMHWQTFWGINVRR
jgi:hypothetical protein